MSQTATIIPIQAPVVPMLSQDEEILVNVIAEVVVGMVINKTT
jgi:hypothetical protein